MELTFLIGRLIYGGFFVMMGMTHFTKFSVMTGYAASKRVPFPHLLVPVTGLMIIFGGLGIVMGANAYIRTSVLLISVFLFLVNIKMHNFWSISDPQEKAYQMTQFLKNSALLGAALMALAIPTPWPYSIF